MTMDGGHEVDRSQMTEDCFCSEESTIRTTSSYIAKSVLIAEQQQLNRHSRPPSAVFSVEKRDAFANQAGKRPSVGTYTPNFWSSSTMPIAGRALFSKSSRDDAGSMTGSTRRAQTPGPGSYSIKPAFSDISASMYGRAKDLKSTDFEVDSPYVV